MFKFSLDNLQLGKPIIFSFLDMPEINSSSKIDKCKQLTEVNFKLDVPDLKTKSIGNSKYAFIYENDNFRAAAIKLDELNQNERRHLNIITKSNNQFNLCGIVANHKLLNGENRMIGLEDIDEDLEDWNIVIDDDNVLLISTKVGLLFKHILNHVR